MLGTEAERLCCRQGGFGLSFGRGQLGVGHRWTQAAGVAPVIQQPGPGWSFWRDGLYCPACCLSSSPTAHPAPFVLQAFVRRARPAPSEGSHCRRGQAGPKSRPVTPLPATPAQHARSTSSPPARGHHQAPAGWGSCATGDSPGRLLGFHPATLAWARLDGCSRRHRA